MTRAPFQGVATVVRFNWHLYVFALTGIGSMVAVAWFFPPWLRLPALLAGAVGLLSLVVSLGATWLAYDRSGLYRLDWLAAWIPTLGTAANIHAGFDETTALLRTRFPRITWRTFDFYDPAKHTEISIQRARRSHPPAPDSVRISTYQLPLPNASLTRVLLMLSAHEIRDAQERIGFFRELNRVLAADGLVVVTEHLRDPANIAAYNVGAWHFHRPSTWKTAFSSAGFTITATFKPAPLITTFILKKHGVAA